MIGEDNKVSGIFSKQAAMDYVSENGYRLQDLSEKLRSDSDVVLAAVSNEPQALRFSRMPARRDYRVRKTVWEKDKSAFLVPPSLR